MVHKHTVCGNKIEKLQGWGSSFRFLFWQGRLGDEKWSVKNILELKQWTICFQCLQLNCWSNLKQAKSAFILSHYQGASWSLGGYLIAHFCKPKAICIGILVMVIPTPADLVSNQKHWLVMCPIFHKFNLVFSKVFFSFPFKSLLLVLLELLHLPRFESCRTVTGLTVLSGEDHLLLKVAPRVNRPLNLICIQWILHTLVARAELISLQEHQWTDVFSTWGILGLTLTPNIVLHENATGDKKALMNHYATNKSQKGKRRALI